MCVIFNDCHSRNVLFPRIVTVCQDRIRLGPKKTSFRAGTLMLGMGKIVIVLFLPFWSFLPSGQPTGTLHSNAVFVADCCYMFFNIFIMTYMNCERGPHNEMRAPAAQAGTWQAQCMTFWRSLQDWWVGKLSVDGFGMPSDLDGFWWISCCSME